MKEIFVVEDNAGDVLLIEEGFEAARAPCRITPVSDGAAALQQLQQRLARGLEMLPSLILLDLNLPKKNGHEVLSELKQHPLLRRIPTLMLSSTRSREDIRKSLDLHANAHLIKPNEPAAYRALAEQICAFWLNLAVSALGPE